MKGPRTHIHTHTHIYTHTHTHTHKDPKLSYLAYIQQFEVTRLPATTTKYFLNLSGSLPGSFYSVCTSRFFIIYGRFKQIRWCDFFVHPIGFPHISFTPYQTWMISFTLPEYMSNCHHCNLHVSMINQFSQFEIDTQRCEG